MSICNKPYLSCPLRAAWLLALITMVAGAALGASPADRPKIYQNGAEKAEVSFQQDSGAVSVRLVQPRGELPASVSFIFKDDRGQSSTIDLRAVRPPATLTPEFRGALPAYTPLGSFKGESFVGLEVRIPWPGGRVSVLKPLAPDLLMTRPRGRD